MPLENLTRLRITQALQRLGELAVEKDIILEVSLYGETVFTLVYASRDSTKDVDAIVRPTKVARELALRVAKELGLHDDWLNDDVRFFVAEQEAKRELNEHQFGGGVKVMVPTASYLLAMKLRACRPPLPGYPGDYADIKFLLTKMEINSVEAAESIHEKFFPHDLLPVATKEVVRTLLPARRP